MTDMDGEARDDSRGGSPPPAAGRAADSIPPELVDELMAKVQADGLELLGEGGVLAELTKRILERALDEERTDHVGYERGDSAGWGSGSSRNGTTPKRVLTEIGPVDLDVPRDRDGSFEPQIVPKHSRRLERFNETIIAWYGRGWSTRDIRRLGKLRASGNRRRMTQPRHHRLVGS